MIIFYSCVLFIFLCLCAILKRLFLYCTIHQKAVQKQTQIPSYFHWSSFHNDSHSFHFSIFLPLTSAQGKHFLRFVCIQKVQMFIDNRQKYIPATPLLHLHCPRHVLLSLLAFEYPLNAKSEMEEVLQMISNVHVFIEWSNQLPPFDIYIYILKFSLTQQTKAQGSGDSVA